MRGRCLTGKARTTAEPSQLLRRSASSRCLKMRIMAPSHHTIVQYLSDFVNYITAEHEGYVHRSAQARGAAFAPCAPLAMRTFRGSYYLLCHRSGMASISGPGIQVPLSLSTTRCRVQPSQKLHPGTTGMKPRPVEMSTSSGDLPSAPAEVESAYTPISIPSDAWKRGSRPARRATAFAASHHRPIRPDPRQQGPRFGTP
jgi:hypothetical protein